MAKVIQVECGYSNMFLLFDDGTVKACGRNHCGQLGLGDKENRLTLTTIPSLDNVQQISSGFAHTVFLLRDGRVKSCGNNFSGELGLGNNQGVTIPTLIPNLSDVQQVACNFISYTLFLLNNGTVKSCGDNSYGSLGLGHTINTAVPSLIPKLNDVKQIAVTGRGAGVSFFLLKDNSVYACGDNQHNISGLGEGISAISTPKRFLSSIQQVSSSAYLLNDGRVQVNGAEDSVLGLGTTNSKVSNPTVIPELKDVKRIFGNCDYHIFLLNDNTVKASPGMCYRLEIEGRENGKVSTIPNLYNLVQASVTSTNGAFLLRDGTVMVFGSNNYGALGLEGVTSEIKTPTMLIEGEFSSPVYYLYLKDQSVYAERNDELVEVAPNYSALSSTVLRDLFLSANTIIAPSGDIYALGSVKVLMYCDDTSFPKPKCSVRAVPKTVLYKSLLLDIADFNGIEQVLLTTNITGSGRVRFLVSTDGENYQTFHDGWQVVNHNDFAAVMSNGLSDEALMSISADQWSVISHGKIKLGFACLLDVEDSNDSCVVEQITVRVSAAGHWDMAMPGTEYKYGYLDSNTLQFTFFADGCYKVKYWD